MNDKTLIQSLKDSNTFKEWIKNPESLKLLPCVDRMIVLAHQSTTKQEIRNKLIINQTSHYLYVFMLIGNTWQASVDVANGTGEEVINRIFIRLND